MLDQDCCERCGEHVPDDAPVYEWLKHAPRFTLYVCINCKEEIIEENAANEIGDELYY